MRRILIIGPPCAGKSYLANELSNMLYIKKYELDDFFWQEDWKRRDTRVFSQNIEKIIMKESSWVIDGYYCEVDSVLKGNVDVIIVMLKPIHVLLIRLIKRSACRIWHKTKVCGNNVENIRFLISPEGMFKYLWRQHKLYQKKWYETHFENAKLIVVKTKKDKLELINKIKDVYGERKEK